MADIVGIDKSLRVPGRLCADPTGISSFPHGGVDLGEALRVELVPSQSVRPIIAEEYGGEAVDYIIRNQEVSLVCLMRGFPTEMMSRVWPGGSGSGATAKVNYPGAGAADRGYLGSTRSFKILFSPQDTVNHCGIILYEAVPLFTETSQMQAMVTEELGMAVVLRGLRRASDEKVAEVARLASISL